MKNKKLVVFISLCLMLFCFAMGVSAQGNTGWEYNNEIGNEVWMQDGVMLTNQWIDDGIALYFVAEDGGRLENGIYNIDGELYAFSEFGRLYVDQSFSITYVNENNKKVKAYLRAKENGTLFCNEWYSVNPQNNDNVYQYRYYYGDNGVAACGVTVIGDQTYLFQEGGLLLSEGTHTISVDGDEHHFVIDKDLRIHEVKSYEWTKIDGAWYYAQSKKFCKNGIYYIGSQYYGFDADGKLFYNQTLKKGDDYYFAQGGAADGALARSKWIYNKTVGGWQYYDADGKLYVNGFYTIGSKEYAFSDGVLCADQIVSRGGFSTTYYYATPIDKNGNGGNICKEKNVWKKVGGEWVYLKSDSTLHVGWLNDKYFMSPQMLHDTYVVDGNDQVYLLAANGVAQKVTTTGFFELVAVQKTSMATQHLNQVTYLKNGKITKNQWVSVKGKWYYLGAWGQLITNGSHKINGVNYCFDETGAMADSGWVHSAYGDWYYAKANGALRTNEWYLYKNKWYYFQENGRMASDESLKINNALYFFNTNGVMADKGWVKDSAGRWYWAAGSGKLFTGVDGAGYVFNGSGQLVINNTCVYNDTFYVTNADGKKLAAFKYVGWYKVGDDWYLTTDSFQTRSFIKESYYKDEYGRAFSFDKTGKMRTNVFYEDRYFGSEGQALTGWFDVDGATYYGVPNNSGQLYRDGIHTINGKRYLFDADGRLQKNTTLFYSKTQKMLTVDQNGVITNEALPQGWVYEQNAANDGGVYYYTNGRAYNGWLGQYYISYGKMCINEFVYINNDTVFYLDEKGRKVSAGWHELFDDCWIYAKADGSVVYTDWLNVGGKWYYFYKGYMVYDTTITVDGEQHTFDKNGVWLGKDIFNVKDGWKQYKGDWYYVLAGQPVKNKALYINGQWYHFTRSGKMAVNSFYKDDTACYYYTASGARANYVGWKYLNGAWVYFENDNRVAWWAYDGKAKYHIIQEEQPDGSIKAYMATGYSVVLWDDEGGDHADDVIYQFDKNGALVRSFKQHGWVKADTDWYYFDGNNYLVTDVDQYKIGDAYYAFDQRGKMLKNEVSEANHRYYDASGKQVTKAGWYATTDGKWVYVFTNGKAAYSGVFKIDGKEYYFADGYWVK